MGESKFTIPGSISEEVKTWVKKNNFQLIWVICKGTREYPVIICPACDCPRLVDYKCDTCAKREMENDYKEFKQEIDRFKIFLKQY